MRLRRATQALACKCCGQSTDVFVDPTTLLCQYCKQCPDCQQYGTACDSDKGCVNADVRVISKCP